MSKRHNISHNGVIQHKKYNFIINQNSIRFNNNNLYDLLLNAKYNFTGGDEVKVVCNVKRFVTNALHTT